MILPTNKNIVVNADVLDFMKVLPDESIHLTFTSPPYYNARDYSTYQSYEHYIQFLSEVCRDIYRVTKEGRFLVLNTSPVIVPRVSRSHSSHRMPIPFDIHHHLINMGWEFIDDIVWVKPEASVKNRNGGFGQHRKPLGYKPNAITEYIMVYRKKTNKLLDWNMRQYDIDTIQNSLITDDYETTNVWNIPPVSNKYHPAVFPHKLCENIIRYYSYVNDVVFDPFAGSGTVGMVANKLNRNFILTEYNAEYFEYIKSNLNFDNTSFFYTTDL